MSSSRAPCATTTSAGTHNHHKSVNGQTHSGRPGEGCAKNGAAMSRSVFAPPVAPASRVPSSRALVVGLGALPLVLLAAIALFELANWDKVTPGVTALGNSVGGMSKAEAIGRLTPGVQRLLDRPLDIHGGEQTWHTTARDLGLRLDPNELVGAAYQIGRQGAPFDRLGEQLNSLSKGRTVSVASTTDRAALDGSITSRSEEH